MPIDNDEQKRGEKRSAEDSYGHVKKQLVQRSNFSVDQSSVEQTTPPASSLENNTNNSSPFVLPLEKLIQYDGIGQTILNSLSVSDLAKVKLTSKSLHEKSSEDDLLINQFIKMRLPRKLLLDPDFKALNKIVDPDDANAILKLAMTTLRKIENKIHLYKITLAELVLLTGHEALLEKVLDFYICDTIRTWAFKFSPLETIKYLVEKRQIPVTQDNLELAAENDSPEIMEYLLSKFIISNPELPVDIFFRILQKLIDTAAKACPNLVYYLSYSLNLQTNEPLLNTAASSGSLAAVKKAIVSGKYPLTRTFWLSVIGSANLELIQFVDSLMICDYASLNDEEHLNVAVAIAYNCRDAEVVFYLKSKGFNFRFCFYEAARAGNELLFSVLLQERKAGLGRHFELLLAEDSQLLDDAALGGNILILEQLDFIPCTLNTLLNAIRSGVFSAVEWAADRLDIKKFDFSEADKESISKALVDMSSVTLGTEYRKICEILESIFEPVELKSPTISM